MAANKVSFSGPSTGPAELGDIYQSLDGMFKGDLYIVTVGTPRVDRQLVNLSSGCRVSGDSLFGIEGSRAFKLIGPGTIKIEIKD